MPSKSLLLQLEEVIEDTKLINDFYLENNGPEGGINEMIPPVKYLLATIADVLNDGLEGRRLRFATEGRINFYFHYKELSGIKRLSSDLKNYDDFDKGILWIIERLNSKDLFSCIESNFDTIKTFYNPNSLILRHKESILHFFKIIDESFTFQLHPEDLYANRIRLKEKPSSKSIPEELNDPETVKVKVYENSGNDEVMNNSSFISMEAVDVKLLQERDLRNDFGFLNRVKYNSLRFIQNFKHYYIKSSKSSLNVQLDEDDFEIVNISACGNEKELAALSGMEICPERGLLAQNYACSLCSNGISVKDSIKCDFSGDYLCEKCHGGGKCINPMRILRNWDFNRYPISLKSKRLIAQISYNELINFPEINPKIFKSDRRFILITQMREKIFKAVQKRLQSAPGKQNQQKQLGIIERLAWPKVHLITSTKLFTIEDLIEIERETFYSNVLVPLYNLLKL